MELHTLGVNGGYTQKDVTEVARVLHRVDDRTAAKGGGFRFEERMHEPGDKSSGHKIKEHGEKEGTEVLRILAQHPSTAHFICSKLAIRFVSDDPPPALVDRMAETFRKKDGEIREVLKTMFNSPEFWSDDAYRVESEDATGICRLGGTCHWSRCKRCVAVGTPVEYARDAAVWHATTHGLFDEIRCVGKLLSTAGPHEFLRGSDVREDQRGANRFRTSAKQ